MMETKVVDCVRKIVELLVAGRYQEIAGITQEQRLDAQSIEKAISDYGRQLEMPPEKEFDLLDVVKVENAERPQFSVRMQLWTMEEGRSDLSLELALTKKNDDYLVEVDDIHVL